MSAGPAVSQRSVQIWPANIIGDLTVPATPRGIVVFAHGTGSSRLSPRNRFVAEVLNQARFGTLLLDLLTAEEEQIDLRTRHLRFNIGLLAARLGDATNWLASEPDTGLLPIGYFGASTGAAAALIASAQFPDSTRAVVSRGGRPDLAREALRDVKAPTLLIAGGNDSPVLELNRLALNELRCEAKLEIVPGATHLFEEPGTLETVAALARNWFQQHLAAGANSPDA